MKHKIKQPEVTYRSLFTPYSIGIVIEDKEKESMMIKVFPLEVQDGVDGELGKTNEEIKSKITNETKIDSDVTTTIVDNIEATWLPISNSNRLTPPDVCGGERVQIYRMGDSNSFFWDTIFNEVDLRKKEHVIFAYSNVPKQGEVLNEKNTYWQGVDCVDKKVKILHTSDNDGEATTYDIDLDTKEGVFSIADGRGNKVSLVSKKDGWMIKTNKLVNVETETMNIKVKTLNIKATDIKTECTSYKIKASTYKLEASNIKLVGNITQQGPLAVKGPASFTPPIPPSSTVAKT